VFMYMYNYASLSVCLCDPCTRHECSYLLYSWCGNWSCGKGCLYSLDWTIALDYWTHPNCHKHALL